MNREDIITHAIEIAGEYGGELTVRQLYYQFVARGLLTSGQKTYQRVVGAVAKARMTGVMPFEWIEDRTRVCKQGDCITNDVDTEDALSEAREWIRSMPRWAIRRGRWFGQPEYVVVGVEKEALSGVFQNPCDELGVGLFVFRGYSSLSALHQFALNLEAACDAEEDGGIEQATLLYFGDFDPDGWEIPRSALRNIEQIADVCELSLPPITLERVALNKRQIARYSPPPFGAKITSSRYASYFDEHGTNDAWELDALPPNVLQTLIREGVEKHFDNRIHRDNAALVGERRAEVRSAMQSDGWLSQVFDGEEE